jgi:FKBP-type peptidyl-prolyl cis-trans isomerase
MRNVVRVAGIMILCLVGLGISRSAGAAEPNAVPEKPTTQPTTQLAPVDNQLAYAAGLDFGTELRDMLHSDHLTADQALVLRGVLDGLNALPPLYSQEEMDKASLRVQRYAANRRARESYASNPEFKRVADENLARSQALLKENGAIEGTETLPNGIQVKVLKDGTGRVLGNAKSMTVNCQITLADGTLVRSTEEGKPLTVQCSKMLPEVVAAMEGMQVGAKWKIVVPPEAAYGLGGKAPLIGPNQAIALVVELVNAE